MKTKLFALGLLSASLIAGCEKPSDATKSGGKSTKAAATKPDHDDHGDGPHGGTVIEFGSFHGEFCVDHPKKQATVYILEENVKDDAPLAVEKLLLSIKNPQFQVDLKADPQPSDPKGKSSRFVATHENFGKEQEFEGTVSGVIDGKPYLGDFQEKAHSEHKDPKKPVDKSKAQAEKDPHGRPIVPVDNSAEAQLYLKPAGGYTEADIKANGNTTVSKKYPALKVAHDLKPKVGDKLCPVTLTKANAELKWIIGGKTYEFCCPPCVEEFVTLAKTKPGEVKEPNEYIKK
jgi:YHS domain-containing protein